MEFIVGKNLNSIRKKLHLNAINCLDENSSFRISADFSQKYQLSSTREKEGRI